MSESEKQKISAENDQLIDRLPEKTLAWVEGYLTGAARATAEAKVDQEREGA